MEKGWKIEATTVSLPALKLDGESREFVLLLLGFVIYVQNAYVLSHVSDIHNTFLKEKNVSCLKKGYLTHYLTVSLHFWKPLSYIFLSYPSFKFFHNISVLQKKYYAGYNGRAGILCQSNSRSVRMPSETLTSFQLLTFIIVALLPPSLVSGHRLWSALTERYPHPVNSGWESGVSRGQTGPTEVTVSAPETPQPLSCERVPSLSCWPEAPEAQRGLAPECCSPSWESPALGAWAGLTFKDTACRWRWWLARWLAEGSLTEPRQRFALRAGLHRDPAQGLASTVLVVGWLQ